MGAVTELRARIAALNPGANIFTAAHGEMDPALLFDTGLYQPGAKTPDVRKWLAAEAYRPVTKNRRHDERIRAYAVTFDKPVVWQHLVDALETLTELRGDNLLRIKGIINVEGEATPRAIHAVQHTIYPAARLPAWPDGDTRTRIVFITRDLDEQFVRNTLQSFLAVTV
jgi:G3E family GTPase